MKRRLKVLFLSAEADPFIKIGGLGDVAGSLPAALVNLPDSPDIRLALPFYPQIKKENWDLSPAAGFDITHSSGPLKTEVFQTESKGVTTYLISGPPILESSDVYGGSADQVGNKFTFFSLAAIELARILSWQPDILHAHDWHTSPAVYNLRLIQNQDPFFQNTKSLLTVHNLPFLGYDTGPALLSYGLPRAHMSPLPEWAEHLPLPLGLLAADKITTVSGGYAKEILTPEFGAHLEGFLKTRQEDIHGILNGLDQVSWNPEQDPALPVNYTIDSLVKRKKNKKSLLKELGLVVDPDRPLLAMINRMDFQKGVDLVPEALGLISELDWQAVILGTGNPDLEESARRLEGNDPRVRAEIRYDGKLARRIYGGADLILIPSRYEPCGLTQMIGMRYGCVPLARATGGLKDTIQDYDTSPPGQGTGFLFEEVTSKQLAETIRRALRTYHDKRRWQGIQRRGMKKDFSWKHSAQQYLKLYRVLTGTRS
jgi:starch synthase